MPVRRRFRFSEPVTVPYGSFPVQFRPTLSRKVSCSAAAEWYLILVDFAILFWLKMALLLNFLLRSLLLPLPLVVMVTTSLAGHIFICDRSVSGVP